MATHNGIVRDGILYNKGDITWADKTAWSSYTRWIEHTDTTIETATGAKGTPLRWQSNIIDLGTIKNVYPEIIVQCTGTPKVAIEYHETSSDLSSSHKLGQYTVDNTATGTIATYCVLDGTEPGYTDDYTGVVSSVAYFISPNGFKGRYIRITVFVEEFFRDQTRGQPVLTNVSTSFKSDTVERTFVDATESTFTKRTDLTPDQYALTAYGRAGVVSMNITPHFVSGKEDITPFITNKQNGGRFAMLDSSGTEVTGWTADVNVRHLPDVRESFLGIEKAK